MKLLLKRSSIWVTDYKLGTSPSLERSLSIYDIHARRYTQKLFDYDESQRILKIARGIGLQHVERKLESDSILISEENIINHYLQFTTPRRITVKLRDDFTLRDDHQIAGSDFLLREKDSQKMLSLDTGYGKTFCTIYSCAKLHMPVIIIVRVLGKQWVNFIREYTLINDDDLVEIIGSESIRKLLLKPSTASFYVASIDTLRSYHQSGGSLQTLSDHLGIGIKVFDEAHLNYVANMVIDANMNVEHTIYLTATPGRSSSNEDRLYKLLFRYVPVAGLYTHVLKQYYNIRYVNYNTLPRPEYIRFCSRKRGFSSMNYATYIFNNHLRKTFFYGLLRHYVKWLLDRDTESRTLIVLDRLSDIQSVHDIMTNDLKITVGRYCTLVKKSEERELELQKRVILTTIGSGVVGKDISQLRLVIAASAFSSPIITRQLLGRLRYLEGKQVYYLDLVDEGFPAMERQRKSRKNELEIRAHSVDTFNVSMDEIIDELRNEFTVPYTEPAKKKLPVKKKKENSTKKVKFAPYYYKKS